MLRHQSLTVKKIIKSQSVVLNGRVLQLPASKGGKGHYQPILARIVDQLDAMLSHHCKLLVFRLDFHLNGGTDNNRLMSEFIRRYRKWTKRQGYSRLGFIWCREQESSKAQHYHCVFIFDGNKTRHPHRHIRQIERLWDAFQQGSVFTPKNCYCVLKRDDDAAYQLLFDRLSYLAKVATKNIRPATTNDYSASRIKAKK